MVDGDEGFWRGAETSGGVEVFGGDEAYDGDEVLDGGEAFDGDENCSAPTGIQDKHAYDDEVAMLKKDRDHLCTEYHKMVDDVSKMFDWHDSIGKVDYQKATDAEKYEKKKEYLEMEKLRLAKEHKCTLKA
ncbi:hypothetical protein D1007_34619 [Hordeum vulgare]|nr:hypothetical protein D1007_34619 [Hordeum vulgare]